MFLSGTDFWRYLDKAYTSVPGSGGSIPLHAIPRVHGLTTPHHSELSETTFHVDEDINHAHDFNMKDEYDDNAASVSFASIAFTSSAPSLAILFDYWVVDSACSVSLTMFWSDLIDFQPPSRMSKVGGVGITLIGSGIIRVHVCLVSGQTVFRLVHALCMHDLTSRSAVSSA
jgi:hypothetical protein